MLKGIRLSILLGAVVWTLGCAKPPTIEITDAENAVNAAEQGGALEYASSDFEAAKEQLNDAKAKVAAKDYKDALALALSSKAKAETALAAVETGRAAAQAAAQAGVNAVNEQITAVSAALTRVKGTAGEEFKKTLNAVEADWTKVQEDFLQDNFNRVNNALAPTQERVGELKAKIEEFLHKKKK